MTNEEKLAAAHASLAGRYPIGAFELVLEGLDRALAKAPPPRKHVHALTLLRNLVEHADDSFGLAAGMVLRELGIVEAQDVGLIVFAMVDSDRLQASSKDRIEDFAVADASLEALLGYYAAKRAATWIIPARSLLR